MKVDYQYLGRQNTYVVTLYVEEQEETAWSVELLQLYSLRFAVAQISPTAWHARTREATREWTAYLGEGEMLSAVCAVGKNEFQGMVLQARQHRLEVVRRTKNLEVCIDRVARARMVSPHRGRTRYAANG